MKVLILCGGQGTRLRDVSELIPKPMVPIGQHPILWHIMKYYSHHGFDDFVLCLGYKKEIIIDYFTNYAARRCDCTVKLGAELAIRYHQVDPSERWSVTLADTGLKALTGSRVRRALRYVDSSPFLLTYGDGLSDVDLPGLIDCHAKAGKLVTVSAVHPVGRWGEISIAGGNVTAFTEKPQITEGFINGGFMVVEREFIDRYVDDDETCALEATSLTRCAQDGQLNAYRHEGFWQCMDTPREFQLLNEMWLSDPRWKVWK